MKQHLTPLTNPDLVKNSLQEQLDDVKAAMELLAPWEQDVLSAELKIGERMLQSPDPKHQRMGESIIKELCDMLFAVLITSRNVDFDLEGVC